MIDRTHVKLGKNCVCFKIVIHITSCSSPSISEIEIEILLILLSILRNQSHSLCFELRKNEARNQTDVKKIIAPVLVPYFSRTLR